MSDVATSRDLFKLALERAEDEYSDLGELWRGLDTKAQTTAAAAGVFMAALFVFVRNASLELVVLEKACLLGALILLVLCVVYAVHTLQIREVPVRPSTVDAKRTRSD